MFILAGVAILLILAAGAGAAFANVRLSEQYSAQRTVADYFVAQQRRDVSQMLANATFLRGDGSYAAFFDRNAVAAMMRLPTNSDIRDVKILSTRLIDSSTDSVTVSMTWSGKQLTREYTVRKDAARVHYLLYPSWRIEIPYEPIQVKLPNQAGLLSVDGIVLPSAASQSALQVVQVIQGFHRVGMQATALLDGTNADVDVSQSGDAVLLKGTLKPSVVGLAATSVKNAFNTCDAGRSQDCINHTYTAPNSDYIWVLNLPGYGQVDYTKYVLTLVGDPTANMNLIVEAETGKVTASGTCASKLTIDDSRTYNFKGDFEAVLTWHGDHFTSDVSSACDRDRA